MMSHNWLESSQGLYYVWRYSDSFAAGRRLCCCIGVVRQFRQPPKMPNEYKTEGKHELVGIV